MRHRILSALIALWIILGLIAVTSCGFIGGSKSKGRYSVPNQSVDSPAELSPDDVSTQVYDPIETATYDPTLDATVKLTLLPEKELDGRTIRYLDALALTEIYSRVFPVRLDRAASERRSAGCGHVQHSFCTQSLFTIEEASALKTLYLGIPRLAEFDRNSAMNLNYLRTLRAMLSRECRILVEHEWETAGSSQTSLLVKRQGVPQTEDLISFAATLHGVSPKTPGIIESLGIQQLIDLYPQAKESALRELENTSASSEGQSLGPDKEAENLDARAHKDAYVALCMTLGLDPVLYIY